MDNFTWDSVFAESNVSFLVNKPMMKEFLKDLGNGIDDKGFVVNAENKKRVISQDEDEIKLKDLGSISSGSKNFIKDNLASYAEFLAQKRNL
ncbi:MAG: hypothetical protein AABX96_03360 [Nanoarchaeota archaeon]